jgi:hypothetical protein
VVLDIFEKLIASDPSKDARPRIEHAQIMTLDDLRRVGEFGGGYQSSGKARPMIHGHCSDCECTTYPRDQRHGLCRESTGISHHPVTCAKS